MKNILKESVLNGLKHKMLGKKSISEPSNTTSVLTEEKKEKCRINKKKNNPKWKEDYIIVPKVSRLTMYHADNEK